MSGSGDHFLLVGMRGSCFTISHEVPSLEVWPFTMASIATFLSPWPSTSSRLTVTVLGALVTGRGVASSTGGRGGTTGGTTGGAGCSCPPGPPGAGGGVTGVSAAGGGVDGVVVVGVTGVRGRSASGCEGGGCG